jgi:hypothetical protein
MSQDEIAEEQEQDEGGREDGEPDEPGALALPDNGDQAEDPCRQAAEDEEDAEVGQGDLNRAGSRLTPRGGDEDDGVDGEEENEEDKDAVRPPAEPRVGTLGKGRRRNGKCGHWRTRLAEIQDRTASLMWDQEFTQ